MLMNIYFYFNKLNITFLIGVSSLQELVFSTIDLNLLE